MHRKNAASSPRPSTQAPTLTVRIIDAPRTPEFDALWPRLLAPVPPKPPRLRKPAPRPQPDREAA